MFLVRFVCQAQQVSQVAADAVFDQVTRDYLLGYLAWRPGEAVSLGLHEYDGQLTGFTRSS